MSKYLIVLFLGLFCFGLQTDHAEAAYNYYRTVTVTSTDTFAQTHSTISNSSLASISNQLSSLKNIVLSLLSFIQVTPSQAQTAGLVASYSFDEGSGTIAADSSGNNIGTLTNGPTWTTGKIGGALSFDGSDDYIKNGNTSSAIENLKEFTYAAWIKPFQLGECESSISICGVIATKTGTAFGYHAFGLNDHNQSGNSNSFRAQARGSPSDINFNTGANTVDYNQWQYVVWTVSSANDITSIYKNGVLLTSAAFTGVLSDESPTGELYISSWVNGSDNFNGLIDEVQIYNRALSIAEIQSLYNQTPAPTPPPTDTQTPSVSITAPNNGATVSGTAVSITATASDNVGVVGVQFKLDGNNLGSEDTAAPYSTNLDTTVLTNGNHSLSAVARDAAGNNTTSAQITIQVSNNTPTPVTPNLPELPRQYVDTTYSLPTGGKTITVNAGGDFQAALNSANLGDIIELQAGATFTGNFTLPNKISGTGWIYIRSSAYNQLPPPGTRVTPVHATLMPRIVSPNGSPAIDAADGAHHFRFIGIEITVAPAVQTIYGIVSLAGNHTSIAQFPHHIIIDRSYVHGMTHDVFRCIFINGLHMAVIDSHISDAHVVGFDSQAILSTNGPGPYKIVNNYLEGSGENIMFGGADSKAPELVPSDIEIRRNHLKKPLSWKVGHPSYAGTPWNVKNLLELKVGRRVLIEGNLLEYTWHHLQFGTAVLFTVRNQDGTAPWSVVEDVTFRSNIVRHAASGIAMLAEDNLQPSQKTRRIAIINNLFDDINRDTWAPTLSSWMFMIPNGLEDLTIEHNTVLSVGTSLAFLGQSPAPKGGFVFRYNIAPTGDYGLSGEGQGAGTGALQYYFPGYVFEKNVIAGANAATYPTGNYYPATIDAAMFIDKAGGNFRLGAGSPYKGLAPGGKDLGVNMDALAAAMAGAIPSPSPTPVPSPIPTPNPPPSPTLPPPGGGEGSSFNSSSTLPTTTAGLLSLLQSLQRELKLLIIKAIAAGAKLPPSLFKYLNTASYIFTKDLSLGEKGDDVYNLQLFLINKQTGLAAQALSKTGATGLFGPMTQSALAEYQASVGISPSVGYFGPKTRNMLNGF